MQRERASAMRTGLAQLATALSLLMVLCLGCSIQTPQTCTNCGSAAGLDVAPQRFAFFPGAEGGLTPGTYRSDVIPRQAGNLVIEAFPVQAGAATALVLDAPIGGSPTQNTDSASAGPPLSAYTKWMVRGVLPTVQLTVTVSSGLWTFFGTFTDVPTTVARPEYYDRNPANKTLSLTGSGFDTFAPPGIGSTGIYTVPANRKAIIDDLFLRIQRVTVAAPAGKAYIVASYQNPPLSLQASLSYVSLWTNGVGDKDSAGPAGAGVMLAGDKLQIIAVDASTGGTVSYFGEAKIFEFDA